MKLNEVIDVVSSNIKSVAYGDGNLYVVYKSGAMYKYKDVKEEVYKELLSAESKGRYMNSNIKGKYLYEKVA